MDIIILKYNNMKSKLVYNIGYDNGEKYIKSKNGIKTKVYEVWKSMFQRCYCKNMLKRKPTYIGCTIDERWHNFQVFAEWYENNYIDGWVLDKDILIKGNKVYGPDTCCFVPAEINGLFPKSNSIRGEYPVGVSFIKNRNKFMAKVSIGNKFIDNKLQILTKSDFLNPEDAFYWYKLNKEEYIIEIANKWKNKITNKLYESLINYKVEITD